MLFSFFLGVLCFFGLFCTGGLQDLIGPDVNVHTHTKYCYPNYPYKSVVRGGFIDVAVAESLQVAVGKGEGCRRENYLDWHFVGAPHAQGVDDVPVDVVEDEQPVAQGQPILAHHQEVQCPYKVGHFE